MAEKAEGFQAVGSEVPRMLESIGLITRKTGDGSDRRRCSAAQHFISWSELIANTVAGGSSAERFRGHLKATAKSAWELAGWLTHANGATRHDAVFVLDATHTVLAAFGHAVIRHESGSQSSARIAARTILRWDLTRSCPTLRIRVRRMRLARSRDALGRPGAASLGAVSASPKRGVLSLDNPSPPLFSATITTCERSAIGGYVPYAPINCRRKPRNAHLFPYLARLSAGDFLHRRRPPARQQLVPPPVQSSMGRAARNHRSTCSPPAPNSMSKPLAERM